jgi:hypothetical protein
MDSVKFLAGGVVVAASLSSLAAGASTVPDLEALAASVSDVRASLHSFDATTAAVVLEGIPGAIDSMEVRHAWSDGRLRLERTHAVGNREFTFQASYDGHAYWTYQEMNRIAARLVAPNAHFMRGGSGLFELMAFFPDVAGLEGDLGSDLEHMLWHGDVSVRSDWDAVGGVSCIVVDRFDRGRLVQSLWLDPSASHHPRQIVHYAGDGSVSVRIEVSEFTEVGGVHFPTLATRVISAAAGLPETTSAGVVEIRVMTTEAGGMALAANHDPASSLFDLSANLPEGSYIFDEATGETRLASASDVRHAAESAIASAPASRIDSGVPCSADAAKPDRQRWFPSAILSPAWACAAASLACIPCAGVAVRRRQVRRNSDAATRS